LPNLFPVKSFEFRCGRAFMSNSNQGRATHPACLGTNPIHKAVQAEFIQQAEVSFRRFSGPDAGEAGRDFGENLSRARARYARVCV
jgi:hypothetical protein